MESHLNESSRELAKGKVMGLAITAFGNEIADLVPDGLNRATIYNEATLIIWDTKSAPNSEMIGLIYNNLSPKMAAAYDKAKYWASHFSDDLNYPLNTGQIMRAFKGKEDLLIAEDVDVAFIVRTLESVGFDLSGWNGTIAPKQDDSIVLPESGLNDTIDPNQDDFIVLPESRLNDNFSDPLPQKTSPAFPGYDVLADILPSGAPDGHEGYAQY
ncbi:MAG: hypothetical protein PHG82_03325 [Candidatus Gracilibacteria bacterium]|nr:hypothetical protein [Candidatus Gracilibacteria bacterium]